MRLTSTSGAILFEDDSPTINSTLRNAINAATCLDGLDLDSCQITDLGDKPTACKYWMLREVIFTGVTSQLSFTHCTIHNCKFKDCDNSVFNFSNMTAAVFDINETTKIQRLGFYCTALYNCSFRKSYLDRVCFDACNLTFCDFTEAVFANTNIMSSAIASCTLRNAKLDGLHLHSMHLTRSCTGLSRVAEVAFTGHGAGGRTLYGIIQNPGDPILLLCGCFTGNEKALWKFIEEGSPAMRGSRTKALETVLSLLKD